MRRVGFKVVVGQPKNEHQHESHVVEESASEPNAYLTRSVHVVGRTVESLAD
jgi:hypothetical protein